MNGINTFEILEGKVEDVVYHNESNDYTIFTLSNKDGILETAVGNIPFVCEGELVVLQGQYTVHREFGRQFAFVGYEKRLPDEIDGILQYLSSRAVKGVGPITAQKIVDKYGMDTFDVIENHPEWLCDIHGITMKKAAAISKSFREQSELRNVMLFFKDFIGTGEVTKVYKKLGASAIGFVKENPYVLCGGECGIPFAKADAIARSLGFSKENGPRILSGTYYLLSYNASTNGHTCLPIDKLVPALAQLLDIDEDLAGASVERFIDSDKLYEITDGDKRYIMTNEVARDEDLIARKIKTLSSSVATFSAVNIATIIHKIETDIGVNYACLQREALFAAVNHGISILTGGPGTGKTTVIKAMIRLFRELDMKVVLAAPTGRAAKRMSEATSYDAKTLHRLLEMERTDTDEVRFNRNERTPLDENVVIVDEASMIDLSLMAALMSAMRRGSRLILIGDSNQLPSVGAGNVLSDLINSGTVETTCLNEIFRQSEESLIVVNAHNVNNGIPPILNATDKDFFFVRRENESDIASTISNLITERLPRTYSSKIKEQIQVITPSRKGAGGVEVLNKELQNSINPPMKFKKERLAHGTIFREGDRVMQIANNYDIEWEKDGYTGQGIFNGDIGVIDSIDMNEEIMNIWFDDRLVRYDFANLDELELSYAITVHKSQGSEYPVVIVPMYSCVPMLQTRNLLYTAITRAKTMVILVGRSDIPMKMVSNNREIVRYTTLINKLKSTIDL